MSKLTICRGLPGAGKDTWAHAQVQASMNAGNNKTIIVNRDSLRFMSGLGSKATSYESTINFMEDTLIERALTKGYDVICTDNNLVAQFVKRLAKIAVDHGAAVEVMDFEVDVEECIRRDKLRGEKNGNCVGEEAIRERARRFLKKGKLPPNPLEGTNIKAVEFEMYVPDRDLRPAFIFDIDGTVANSEGIRSPYDYDKVGLDRVIDEVVHMYHILNQAKYPIIFLSGRPETCKPATEKWLWDYGMTTYEGLFMRAANDLKRKDFIVKYELFDKYIRHNYNVIGVFDDRKQVIDNCWRKIGVRCYDVAGHTF